jgi:hypothetical protein
MRSLDLFGGNSLGYYYSMRNPKRAFQHHRSLDSAKPGKAGQAEAAKEAGAADGGMVTLFAE